MYSYKSGESQMKGLELSKNYFEEYGRPMLEAEFRDILPYLAAGLFGSGSECFGYDDEVSRDHDFEPGFCIFLPDESVIDRRTAFMLERAYAKLPKEFMGAKSQMLAPVGGMRRSTIWQKLSTGRSSSTIMGKSTEFVNS